MSKREEHLHNTYNRALEAVASNMPQRAKMLLQNILITEPSFSPALNDLAVLYFQEGEYEQAIQLFQKIELIDPELQYFKDNYSQVLRALELDTKLSQ